MYTYAHLLESVLDSIIIPASLVRGGMYYLIPTSNNIDYNQWLVRMNGTIVESEVQYYGYVVVSHEIILVLRSARILTLFHVTCSPHKRSSY